MPIRKNRIQEVYENPKISSNLSYTAAEISKQSILKIIYFYPYQVTLEQSLPPKIIHVVYNFANSFWTSKAIIPSEAFSIGKTAIIEKR